MSRPGHRWTPPVRSTVIENLSAHTLARGRDPANICRIISERSSSLRTRGDPVFTVGLARPSPSSPRPRGDRKDTLKVFLNLPLLPAHAGVPWLRRSSS